MMMRKAKLRNSGRIIQNILNGKIMGKAGREPGIFSGREHV